ncbi:uncharacterized mitochondrial protein AtMg00810-like [Rutidosis leptorrhynchoides]|uniref:uncharacterized mitochondrial protein AtMg00810-like n=1 Tax=Rutidosis leptorrhynchoides TaxID=125765 RepID=UPI003A98D292
MWLFRHKYNANGTLSRYKARVVANGRCQQIEIDRDETFSPVVQPATIPSWISAQNTLTIWCDSSLFIYRRGSHIAYLLLYVADIILTTSSTDFLWRVIQSLHREFSMIDLGPLNYFLGISATRNSTVMFLSQRKYATEILEYACMLHCNPSRTVVDTNSKLGEDGPAITNPTLYCSLEGTLQYLTFTRPDTSYVVQQVCLFMHDPRGPHFSVLKRILRYVRGTLNLVLDYILLRQLLLWIIQISIGRSAPLFAGLHLDIVFSLEIKPALLVL